MRTHAAWLLLAVSAAACGQPASSDPPPPDNTRASGGRSGSGGTPGSGGAPGSGGTAAGTGGTTSAGTGGAAPAGTGGTAAGTGGTSAGTGGTPADAAAAETATPTPPAADAPFGCTGCKRIFDGKTLDGWETRDPTNWMAKDGALASQGKVAPIWTKADYGNYRIFFKVRQVMGNHRPDVIFFGKRPGPGAGASGALGGAQFQPPNGGSWDYGAGGTFSRPENPNWDPQKWHHCEVLVKEAGSFQAACCPIEPAPAACKVVLNWKGAGRKHPWAIQMHNAGLFDEYKDIFVEENPAADELLCMKK